jgi:hypothetical protein
MLSKHLRELTVMLTDTGWSGNDADRFRVEWRNTSAPALSAVTAFIDTLSRRLTIQAMDQESASAAAVTIARSAVRSGVRSGVGSSVGSADVGPIRLSGLRPSRFPDPGDARATLVDAITGCSAEGRIRRDEIEIRALDNGRFIVVLPGVTDLTAGIAEFATQLRKHGLFGLDDGILGARHVWSDNDEPTVRKMRYAYDAALHDDTDVNEYAAMVTAAMRNSGVPLGADVMLVGHSFGAYTAVDLAADPAFNGAYVNVTHVVAAAADTDWRFDELRASTATLILNNRWDVAFRAESGLHFGGRPDAPNELEINFWGGLGGAGHDVDNYANWIERATDRADLDGWLGSVEPMYTSGGERVSVSVPDPVLVRIAA